MDMKIFRTKFDRSYFDNFAYRSRGNSQRNQNRLREILRYHRQGKLLEVGCGLGSFLKLAHRHFEVFGIDISAYAIDLLRPKYGEHVRQMDLERDKLTVEKYEVVAAFNVFEHLFQPEIAIQQVYQSLSDKGILFGSVPNNTPLIGWLHTGLTNFFDRTHRSTYPPGRWRQLFRETGFQKIQFFGEMVLGGNYSFYIRNILWSRFSFNLMFVCEKPAASP